MTKPDQSTSSSELSHSTPPREWLSDVFVQLEQPLVVYVQRMLGEPSLAQDIVQEAFVKLCQQPWPEIKGRFRAWLYKTCRNRVIDIKRREGRMKTIQGEADMNSLRDPQSVVPSNEAERNDEIHAMRTKVGALPERQQELLRLRLQEGLSYKQIAEVTGLSASNVGYLLHQAISSLRTSAGV